MSAILEDPSAWRSFFPDPSAHLAPAQDAIDLEVFEWYSDSNVQPQHLPSLKTAKELIDLDGDVDSTCSLRVVLATQEPSKRREDNHRKPPYQAIYEHYSFPSYWIMERVQSATCSFGTQQNAEDANVNISWLRLTCKDVQKRKTKQIGKWHMYELVDGDDRVRRGGSQASSMWWHLDALVHTRVRQDGSKCVTLLCFSKRPDLEARFEQLLSCKKWTDAVEEHYLLFSILLEKWFVTLDEVSWNLADVFRPIEELTFERADVRQPQQQEQQQDKDNNDSFRLDFAGLHNLSKHCTYLLEAAEAALLVLDQLSSSLPTPTTPLSTTTLTSLIYRRTTFRSTQLRLRSLQSRMTNLLALSFNLVTQDDSQTMKTDSNAMKAIAVLTLIFLPLTGIASMFSTPFFNVDFETKRQWLQIAESFWVFWVITAPSTVLMFGAWAAWYYRGRIKLTVGGVVKAWKRRGDEARKGADEEAIVSRQPREPALSSRTMELRKTLFFRSREMGSAN